MSDSKQDTQARLVDGTQLEMGGDYEDDERVVFRAQFSDKFITYKMVAITLFFTLTIFMIPFLIRTLRRVVLAAVHVGRDAGCVPRVHHASAAVHVHFHCCKLPEQGASLRAAKRRGRQGGGGEGCRCWRQAGPAAVRAVRCLHVHHGCLLRS